MCTSIKLGPSLFSIVQSTAPQETSLQCTVETTYHSLLPPRLDSLSFWRWGDQHCLHNIHRQMQNFLPCPSFERSVPKPLKSQDMTETPQVGIELG